MSAPSLQVVPVPAPCPLLAQQEHCSHNGTYLTLRTSFTDLYPGVVEVYLHSTAPSASSNFLDLLHPLPSRTLKGFRLSQKSAILTPSMSIILQCCSRTSPLSTTCKRGWGVECSRMKVLGVSRRSYRSIWRWTIRPCLKALGQQVRYYLATRKWRWSMGPLYSRKNSTEVPVLYKTTSKKPWAVRIVLCCGSKACHIKKNWSHVAPLDWSPSWPLVWWYTVGLFSLEPSGHQVIFRYNECMIW